MRAEDSPDEKQKLVQAQRLNVRPLRAEDGPKGREPGLDAGGLQARHQIGEVGGESLLRSWAVGHPEGVVEACPELAGVEGGEGLAGGKEGLEGGEGFGAEFAVCDGVSFDVIHEERRKDGPLEARFLIKGICCASCAETAAEAAIVTKGIDMIWRMNVRFQIQQQFPGIISTAGCD